MVLYTRTQCEINTVCSSTTLNLFYNAFSSSLRYIHHTVTKSIYMCIFIHIHVLQLRYILHPFSVVISIIKGLLGLGEVGVVTGLEP